MKTLKLYKPIFGLLVFIAFAVNPAFSQNPAYEIQSTTGGFVAPKMLQAQRIALANVAGNLVYQTDGTAGYYYNDGATWARLNDFSNSGSVSQIWFKGAVNNGNATNYAAGGNFIIGYTNRTAGLFYSNTYAGAYTAANSDTWLKMPKCIITSIRVTLVIASTTTGTSTFNIVNQSSGTTSFGSIAAGAPVGEYELTGSAVCAAGDLISIENIGSTSTGALNILKIQITYTILP